MNTSLCIIPARGGSKRIPDKNIREFAGKPIIAHSIETARASGLFDCVMVSTDSERIAEVAMGYGAEVPFFRSPELSDDKAGIDKVLMDVLLKYRALGRNFRNACCLFATAPLVTIEAIDRGLKALVDSEARMSLAVTTFPYCIFRALKSDDAGRAVMLWPENLTRHSQEFPEAFHDAGQFFWIEVERFLTDGQPLLTDTVPVFISRDQVQDIDTPEDWSQAELKFERMRSSAIARQEQSHGRD